MTARPGSAQPVPVVYWVTVAAVHLAYCLVVGAVSVGVAATVHRALGPVGAFAHIVPAVLAAVMAVGAGLMHDVVLERSGTIGFLRHVFGVGQAKGD